MSPRVAVWIPAFAALLLAAAIVMAVGMAMHGIGGRSESVKDQNEAVAEAERALWAVRRVAELGLQLKAIGALDDDFGFTYLDTYRTLEDLVRPAGFLALAEDAKVVATIRTHVDALAYTDTLNATKILDTTRTLEPLIDGVRRALWARKRDTYVDFYRAVQAAVRQMDITFIVAGIVGLLGALPLALIFGLRLHRRTHAAASMATGIAGSSTQIDDPITAINDALRALDGRIRAEGGAGRLAEALDEEHRRIALDMHDEVLTELTALSRVAETLESESVQGHPTDPSALRNLREGLNDLAVDIRGVIDDLYPPVIDTLGLASALEGQMERLQSRFPDIKFAAAIEPACTDNLGRDHALSAYRATLEAIANALRHAGADRIDVDLHKDGARLCLSVEDNGGKVTGETWTAFNEGRGMAGIRHRAARLGGHATWARSRYSSGTKLTIEIPTP